IPAFATPDEVATLSTAFIKSQASMLRTLEERSQARDWLNTLIQSIVEGVVTFDNRGQVTFVSQGAESVTGWPSAEAVGQSVDRLLPPVDEPSTPLRNRIPPLGGQRLIETLTRSGKPLTLAVSSTRLPAASGQTEQVALVLRDVTHEEALRHLHTYFLASISHEFQTPLSTLNASLDLLLDQAESYSIAEVHEVLKPAHLSLLTLQNLVNNLLQSGSIEAGYFTIRRQPTDLQQVVTDAQRLVQPLLDRRRQLLTITLPTPYTAIADLPDMQADPARLVQAVVNLLVNASKYSPVGQPIELGFDLTPTLLRVTVADRGPGIPPTERTHLFQRFVRLEAQNREQYGIGLGLYVVKTIIEAHGGQLGVDARLGGGSIFWFEIPTNDERRTTNDQR
ncbi:MAG: PAS domain-containing sensor histidine kinase, partial [Chloroflexota bacterium]|nr:PAS domain-containing sensor histidine kinase [Chloroflexota bacterium]